MTATRIATASAMSEASQALIRTTPSSTNRVSRGSIATRAVRKREPATASRTGRNMGQHLAWCGRAGVSGHSEVPCIQAPDRGVEHLDGVGEGELPPGSLDGGGDLHQAARVRRDEHLSAGRHDVLRLAIPELARRLGVE